jgi:hypothetical protein
MTYPSWPLDNRTTAPWKIAILYLSILQYQNFTEIVLREEATAILAEASATKAVLERVLACGAVRLYLTEIDSVILDLFFFAFGDWHAFLLRDTLDGRG